MTVLAATALVGCSSSSPSGQPTPAFPSDQGATQEAAALLALMDTAQVPFSATLSERITDSNSDAKINGAVNVADIQTGELSVIGLDGGVVTTVYLTLTRNASYHRTGEGPWTRTERAAEPLVADHRPLVRALLGNNPASYRGMEKLRTRRGGQAYRLSGRLPVAELREAVSTRNLQRLAEHHIADCGTDLLVNTDGRLSELTVDCAGDGYQLTSTLDLSEFGPVTEPEAPTGQ
ncbi:hypothetical protein [Kitasatospora cineracea]|uniref:hypothetical protein n=1 Tax=Kitasatospora cineracea TaxID=88074 RepID=UPI000F4F08E8|nr:hypothetical protein [Kitasatospora cineracea]